MHIPSRVRMQHHLISWAVAALFTVMGFIGSAAAPSTDRDHPTPLMSNEITETSGGTAGDYYYTFIAGPGQVALTLDAKTSDVTSLQVEVFDMNADRLFYTQLASCCNKSERKVGHVQIPTRQRLVMRLHLQGVTQRYRVRVEGAVEFVQAGPASEKPSSGQGKLRIEMSDGSVQEVDLSHVRRLTIEP